MNINKDDVVVIRHERGDEEGIAWNRPNKLGGFLVRFHDGTFSTWNVRDVIKHVAAK